MEYMLSTVQDNSCNNFEAYKQGVLVSLCLVEDNLMPILCAVNTDFTELEDQPGHLALVDNPIQSTKTCMAWDTASFQSRLLYQVRILNSLLHYKVCLLGNVSTCQGIICTQRHARTETRSFGESD